MLLFTRTIVETIMCPIPAHTIFSDRFPVSIVALTFAGISLKQRFYIS